MKKDIKILELELKPNFSGTHAHQLKKYLEKGYNITSSVAYRIGDYSKILYTLEKVIDEPKTRSDNYFEYFELELAYYEREIKDINLNDNLYSYFKDKIQLYRNLLNK